MFELQHWKKQFRIRITWDCLPNLLKDAVKTVKIQQILLFFTVMLTKT